jgi:serine/threonine-protein kinase
MPSTGTLAAGTLVAGRYRIEEPLAGDGSGAVYRAADTRLDRDVALRVLPAAQAGAQQGKAAARLVHPNVARVLDFGADAELGTEFVVADLGTGGSLAALLAQRGAPPLPLALRMIQEAAAGMAAAHRAGLVHGDLHPGVLWLSRDEGRLRVQVLGLGLNPAGSPPPRTTARYAAPERLRRARDLSSAADVFSLGVVAYEMFVGLPADWTQLLLQMARGQAVVAPSLLEARPDLPAHVAQAVRRALAADPASRWPEAGDLAAHLIADLAAQPQAGKPSVPVPSIVAAPAAKAAAAPVAARVTEPVAAAAPAPVIAAAPAPDFRAEQASAPQPVAAEAADHDAADEADLSTLAQEAVRAMANAGPPIDPTADVAEPEPVAEVVAAPAAEPVVAEAVAIAAEFVDIAPAAAKQATEPVSAEVVSFATAAEPVDIAPAAVEQAEPIAEILPPAPVTEEAVPKPTRQPLTAGRRSKPIALASTDLADTLYIPPVLQKRASAPAAASAEEHATGPSAPPPAEIVAPPVIAAPVAAVPAEPVAQPVIEMPIAAAPVEPAAPFVQPVVAETPVVATAPIAPAPAADETLLAAYAPPAAMEAPAAIVPVAPIPLRPERRRPGMERLGKPAGSGQRGLLAAGIVLSLLVAGGVVAKTVLAGGPDAPVVQNLASAAAAKATVGGAPAAAPPQAPAADPAVPGAVADSVAQPNPALTPAEQRKQDEERRRAEEQRRQQQRQQDSLRQVQLAARAAQPAAVPQQVALQNAPRSAAPAAAPQLEQRAPAAAPAPAAAAPAPEPARPAAADANRVYSADELDTRPSLANRAAFQNAVQRTYPGTLRGSSTWGSAVVSFVVLPDGRVDRSSVTVEQASQPAFRAAATAAIGNARFNPARIGGQPVRTTVSMPITWNGGGRDDD